MRNAASSRSLLAIMLVGLLTASAFLVVRLDERSPKAASLPKPAAAPVPREPGHDFAQPLSQPSAPPPPAYIRTLLPELDAHVRDWRTFTPASLVLRVSPDQPVAFDVVDVEAHPDRTVLTARLQGVDPDDHPLAGSFLVSTAVASDRWDALVVLPGMEYRVAVRPTGVTVEEAAPGDFACGAEGDAMPLAGAEQPPGESAGDGHAPLTIDVLFLYNPTALSERNNDVQAIEADASNYIAASNAALANSRVTAFRWNYLGTVATPAYTSGETIGDDLRAMRGTGEISRFVFDTQIPRGADQVVLLAGGIKQPAAGNAWLGGNFAHSAASYPYPTRSNGERSTQVTSYRLIAHELGHNFECRHHRSAEGENAPDGNGQYHYGHITSDNFGTIMTSTVGSTHGIIPYFSTPDVTFRGQPVGLAADQPRAAHNARTLADNAGRIAALEERPTSVPVITLQPQNTSVARGERLTLSVAATGGGLTYEWRLNGTTISPVSAEISAADFDDDLAGTYTVLVKNSLGSVTSEPAVVSLATPTPPPPAPPPVAPPPASTSSGGGGGSLPGLFAGALALLALGREWQRTPDYRRRNQD